MEVIENLPKCRYDKRTESTDGAVDGVSKTGSSGELTCKH